jgi:hypothetical protein
MRIDNRERNLMAVQYSTRVYISTVLSSYSGGANQYDINMRCFVAVL